MDITEVLFALSRACGVSGDERGSSETALELLAPLVDEVHVDVLGSVIGIRKSKRSNAGTVLLDAHIDEVGLMITGNEGGLLRFAACVGGVDMRLLPGLTVKVLTPEPLMGVIHVAPSEEPVEQTVSPEQLRIDCGITEEAAKTIPVGTRVAYATEPWKFGNRVFGKAMDDRACFAALLRAMELIKEDELDVNVAVLGSVREEKGGIGAKAGTFGIRPKLAVVTDVTFGDSPDSPKAHSAPLGSGSAIGYSPVLDRRYTKRLKALAEEHGFPYTQEIMEGGTGTNSMETQIAGGGVPSVLISMPLRYMHTSVECVDLRDAEALAQLIAAFLRTFEEVRQ